MPFFPIGLKQLYFNLWRNLSPLRKWYIHYLSILSMFVKTFDPADWNDSLTVSQDLYIQMFMQ